MTHAALRATRKHATTGADSASYETGTSPGPGVTVLSRRVRLVAATPERPLRFFRFC